MRSPNHFLGNKLIKSNLFQVIINKSLNNNKNKDQLTTPVPGYKQGHEGKEKLGIQLY